MFINDFDLKISMNGDADNFALVTISDARVNPINKGSKPFNEKPCISIPIEHATPELIGEAIAKYITEHLTEDKGWTIWYYPWDDDNGKPRVAGRFKTDEEKDKFLAEINKPDSGWLREELNTISIENDYWFMLPV